MLGFFAISLLVFLFIINQYLAGTYVETISLCSVVTAEYRIWNNFSAKEVGFAGASICLVSGEGHILPQDEA